MKSCKHGLASLNSYVKFMKHSLRLRTQGLRKDSPQNFMRTTKNCEQFMNAVDDILYDTFVPTLIGIDTPRDNLQTKIISQSPKY